MKNKPADLHVSQLEKGNILNERMNELMKNNNSNNYKSKL